MIKKFNIFEKIEWYEDGEFIEDDSPEEMNFSDPIEYFKYFLKNRNAYEKYLTNVNNYYYEVDRRFKKLDNDSLNSFLKKIEHMDWINSPLNWGATPEGHNYWRDLNNEWKIAKSDYKKGIYEKIEWYKDGEFIEDDSPEESFDHLVDYFFYFLENRKILDAYIHNLGISLGKVMTKDNVRDYLMRNYKSDFVNGPLIWSSTKEGHDYWSRINTEWLKAVKNYQMGIYERIEWYKNGEFVEDDSPEESINISIGDRVKVINREGAYWDEDEHKFRRTSRDIGDVFKVTDVKEVGGFKCVHDHAGNGWYKIECLEKLEKYD